MLNYIDLFAGCGGLSEGFIRKGFNSIAHIEMNKDAIDTLKTRMVYYYLKRNKKLDQYYKYLRKEINRDELHSLAPKNLLNTCICDTISYQSINNIFDNVDVLLKDKKVDVIIGGPPCQAYSLVGRSIKSAKDKEKIKNNEYIEEDPRNYLYKLYCMFLKKYKPKIFVFENVAGLLSAKQGKFYKNFKALARRNGYVVDDKILISSDYGVLQARKRVIIMGWLKKLDLKYPDFKKNIAQTTINEMFNDLPFLNQGEEKKKYSNNKISEYCLKYKIRESSDVLTQHVARPTLERDRKIYEIAVNLWNNGHQRLHYDELPENLKTHKNRKSFIDRFKVVEGDTNECHTMMAHISKDGHYFIHPDIQQRRSISVREAARIQSFPDSYFFEGGRTAAFMQIGNAVPPLMAEEIAKQVKLMLKNIKE